MGEAQDIIKKLELAPHPEGGWYRETWRADSADGERAAGTAIYYLLEKGQRSHWHRVDAAEIWHFYAGAPLELSLSQDGVASSAQKLGNDFAQGEAPQIIVPPNCWQAAQSLGDWTLVGCTVSPGFEFENFEMADADWAPRNQ
ncbi:MAG: cupin [Hyphococcus sp.]|nr:MAG: cupin [Marinicaulis sp.]